MGEEDPRKAEALHEVSVVVPVYQGERTLEALADELALLTGPQKSPGGRRFRVAELLLVHVGAVDVSADVMSRVSPRPPLCRSVRLSRHPAQHPATPAG